MARLHSEDKEFTSFFAIEARDFIDIDIKADQQRWQLLKLTMQNGDRKLEFETSPFNPDISPTTPAPSPGIRASEDSKLAAAIGNIQTVADAYLVCRSPQDEMAALVKLLEGLLEGTRNKVLFEPAEPSFEFAIEGSGGGLKVHIFVDAGNVETGIFRWDALGIRFFTNNEKLASFIQELKAEFSC